MSQSSGENLNETRDGGQREISAPDHIRVLICGGNSGNGCKATERIRVKDALVAEVGKRGLSDKVEIVETGCNGFCDTGPTLIVKPAGIFYVQLKPEDIPEIVEEQIINNKVVERLLFFDPVSKKRIAKHHDLVRKISFRMTRLISGRT